MHGVILHTVHGGMNAPEGDIEYMGGLNLQFLAQIAVYLGNGTR